MNELKLLIDTVPQVEAEFNRLNRDYEIVKAKYGQLSHQLERANIGEDIENSIDDAQFRIIDPPFASPQPAGPNRHLFIAGILFGAVVIGSALAFLLNLLHPVFCTGESVSATLGIPVLGTIKFVMSPSQLREKKRSRYRFATAFGLLMVFFVLASVYADQLSTVIRSMVGVTT